MRIVMMESWICQKRNLKLLHLKKNEMEKLKKLFAEVTTIRTNLLSVTLLLLQYIARIVCFIIIYYF